ncbi:MAG: hypothetical protein BroJett040_00630 [Oligoflexia bacterium]|nr:MAG: hypothetical protein BroJett040_00630 [Oligoflexia bacterium]
MKIIMTICGLLLLAGCSTRQKCPSSDGFNSVIEQKSCQVRIRNVIYAEDISVEVKEQIAKGQQVEFIWVSAAQRGPVIVPSHYEYKIVAEGQ